MLLIHAMADDDKSEPKESVWDILKEVLPEVIRALMKYAGVRSQERFAEMAGVNANQVSRYINGTEFPTTNLPRLGRKLGLAAGSVWWLLGHMIEKKFRRFKIDLDGQPGVVREPAPPYDESFEERYDTIMELDLSVLETYDGVRLTRSRHVLQQSYEQSEGQRRALEGQMADFLERYNDALSRAGRRS